MHLSYDWHVILLFMIFGGIFSHDLIMGVLSKRWSHATGSITHVKAPSISRLEPRRVTIGYTYEVDDKVYSSNRVSYPDPAAGASALLYSDYPDGSDVIVFYNPRNPKSSCLRPGFKPNWLTAALLFLFCACLFVLVTLGA
jgi:hypothetical protein